MTRPGGAGARFRQRKLSNKQSLQILTEEQLGDVDHEQQRAVQKVETGVEKAEEIEHHLQAAISASQAAAVGGKVAQIYIPTPDTIQSKIQYDRLYPPRFSQPATYIRFSSTVEECCGALYCMTKEDDVYLKSLNQNNPASASKCSEDQFEQLMDFFEQYSRSSQPYAMVDNAPVIDFDEMARSAEFHETVDENARPFAKDIYEHWKARRTRRGNRSLAPQLKVETNQETDDGDPYICFRRREVRQIRKTRGRDAQSIEKLRKLRKELEDARKLIALVRTREMSKRELLGVEKILFEQRAEVKNIKRKLGIKGDDDDLINQKPQKKKTAEQTQAQRASGPQLRLSLRPDGRPPESDLVLLQDTLREKENEIQKDIEVKLAEHRAWLTRLLEYTRKPLTAPLEINPNPGFRAAVTEYLPTPPASASSESPIDLDHHLAKSPTETGDDGIMIRYATPPESGPGQDQVFFRRRFGRGGRLMIDRRGMRLQSTEGIDPIVLDRFKFDRDDENDENPRYEVDTEDFRSMQCRASIGRNRADPNPHRPFQANGLSGATDCSGA
ncbi:MAG: Enhancer of polycomb-like protein 1 [Peltula sp. TS41687]|nr:MAG: Enhancer of polycomb-like protein 1 [Peltula sp. TS41687]